MAVVVIRKLFKRLFILLNSIVAALFLVACLVPYLNPEVWWFMGFFGLMVPYLAILLVFFIFFWLVFRPVLALLPVIILLIGYSQLSVLFAVNKFEIFTEKKDSSHIRILDWNVRNLEGMSGKAYIKKLDRKTIPEAIISLNPDVICLQEFNSSAGQNNIASFTGKYPYYYFSRDFRNPAKGYAAGCIIFSKFPIVDSGSKKLNGPNSESIIYADIKMPGKIIRVFTVHLESFRFTAKNYEEIEKIKKTEEDALPASKSIISKMKQAFTRRGRQSRNVRLLLDKSPHPSVICGDFNDVPNSFTYFHIKQNWQDVFLEKYLGIGRTYQALAPTLRIDYILPDNNFNIHQFDMIDEDLSDHLMLVSDISLK